MTKASKIKVPKEMTRKHLARAEREARQKRWMLIGLAVTFILAFGLLGYGVLDERVLKMQQPVATVNGKNITTAEFQKRVRFQSFQINVQLSQLETQRQQFASDPSLSFITQQIDQQISSLQSMLSDPPTLGKQVLDRIIEEELVRQEAARRNISVSPDEIQTEIEHSYNFYRVPPTPTPEPTITPTPSASPTPEPTATTSITPTATPGPTDTPEPTATPVTEQAFNTAFSTYLSQIAPTGMTRDDLNQLVNFDLLRQKLQEEFNKNVPTSADQIQFRYIDFETLEKAQEAETQLKSGTSFDDLYDRVQAGDVVSATAYTEPWTPVGDLTSQLDQKITDLVLSLGISQTSQIITDTLMPGALIFQQTGRGVQTLSPYQLQTEQQKAYQTWLDTQLNGPGVNYYNNRYLQRIPTQ